MENTYGYIRTSRQRIQRTAGSDPEARVIQLRLDGEQSAKLHNTFTFIQLDLCRYRITPAPKDFGFLTPLGMTVGRVLAGWRWAGGYITQ